MAEEKIEEEKLTGIKPVILVPRETNDPLVRELVLTDGNKVIRGDFGTEILFDDVVITIKRLSPFFSRNYEHNDCILTNDYEAPLILGEEEERDCWSSTFFIRVQKLNAPVKRCGPSTVAKFLEDDSTIEMILKNKDGTFLFRKVKVRVQIRLKENSTPKEIESVQYDFDNDTRASGLKVKYKEDPSKDCSYDITCYQNHISGRLLLGRAKTMKKANNQKADNQKTNDQKATKQKEIYSGFLENGEIKEKVALKILNCRLKDDWQGAVQGITLDGLVIDDVGDIIVHEIAIMQKIAESLLPNGEHPHLALGKGIYTTVSDTQRTGHLLVAFPYQSNSSLLSFLESKKFKSSGSEQKLKMIRFITKDIAMGLHQLHELGYAHLDLTLENIVVTADYRCMLIDFGQARKINANMKVNLTELECKKQYYNPFHLRCFGGIEKDVILSGEMLKMIDMWNLGIIVMTALYGALYGKDKLEVPNWMKGTAPFETPILHASLNQCVRRISIWVANSKRILQLKLESELANYDGLQLAVALLKCECAKSSGKPEDLKAAESLLKRQRATFSNKCVNLEMAETLIEQVKRSDTSEDLEMVAFCLKRAKRSDKYVGLKFALALLESQRVNCSDKHKDSLEEAVASLKSELSHKYEDLEFAVSDKYEDLESAGTYLKSVREKHSHKHKDLELADTFLKWERAKRSEECDRLELAETLLEWESAEHSSKYKDSLEVAVALLESECAKRFGKCEGLELAMQLLCHNLYFSILSEESTKEDITEKLLKLSEDVQNHPWLRSLNDEERPTTFAQWTAASGDEKSTGKRSRFKDDSQDVTSQESETSTDVTPEKKSSKTN